MGKYNYNKTNWIGGKTIGTADIMNNLEEGVYQAHERLDSVFVNILDFGASVSNDDNKPFIMDALDYCNSQGGGTVFIPCGTFKTSPMILSSSYKNITVKGVCTPLTYSEVSELKIISNGEIGFQLSDNSQIPLWTSTCIKFQDICLNGNYNVETVINLNFNHFLDNVYVKNSNGDGIVIEGQSYPVDMRNVFSQFNKGNGLFIKAPYTTCYTINNCEFNYNDGYGIYIKDGSTSSFRDIKIQSNKKGGIKIYMDDPSIYSRPIFLERLLFENIYFENNGNLVSDDPVFEGNYAIVIDSYNTSTDSYIGKINDLTFINCSVNKSENGDFSNIKGTAYMSVINSNNITVSESFNILNAYQRYNEGETNVLIGQIGNNFETTKNTLRYFRRGKIVDCFLDVEWVNKGNASPVYNCVLSGLPYTVDEKNTYSVSIDVILADSTKNFSILPSQNENLCYFRCNNVNDYAKISDFPENGKMTIHFSYLAK